MTSTFSHLRKLKILGFVTLFCLGSSINTQLYAQRWEKVWSEDFNGSSVDQGTWTFWHGTAYNNELQYYTSRPENVFVEDGLLHIVARKEDYEGRHYTSARMKSQYSGDWKYGRFIIRAKLPEGKGFWPAIWMMPTDSRYGGWPHSGEVDIMEYRGDDINTISGTLHYWKNNRHQWTGTEYDLSSGDFSNEFHDFELRWMPGEFRWYVDGNLFQTLTKDDLNADPWPFNKRFYMILNLAVGGDFLDNPDNTTPFPGQLIVDYVHVYQDANQKPTVQITTPGQQDPLDPSQPIHFQLSANDTDGSVEKVKLFIEDSLWAVDASEPFEAYWNNPIEGCYNVRAVAYDNDNGISDTTSADLTVGHGCKPTSYNSELLNIPGTIYFSQYDYGGQNISYYDTSPYEQLGNQSGLNFRLHEGVDLRPLADKTDSIAVGWIKNREWLKYTVNVTQTADYDLTVYLRKTFRNTTFHLNWDGAFLYRFLQFPEVGDTSTIVTKTVENTKLDRGIHKLQWVSESSGYELIKMVVSKSNATSTETPPSIPGRTSIKPNYPNPFNPTTNVEILLNAPQQVQLEVFDLSGRQLASLFEGYLSTGSHHFTVHADHWSSGVYVLRLTTQHGIWQRKMLLIK